METGPCKWNCAGDTHRLLAGRRRSPSTTRTFKALISKGCVVWPPAHTHVTECPCLIMKSAVRGLFPGSWQPRNKGWKLYSEVRNNKLTRAEPLRAKSVDGPRSRRIRAAQAVILLPLIGAATPLRTQRICCFRWRQPSRTRRLAGIFGATPWARPICRGTFSYSHRRFLPLLFSHRPFY